MKDWPVYLGFGSALALGLLFFGLGARNLWRAIASYRWPTTTATVVQSSTDVTTSGGSGHFRSSSQVPSTIYTANLKFQYEVSGRTYRTDLIYIGQTVGSGDSSEAELRRFRYPMGANVEVRYDPANPSIASVHAGFQQEVLWLPGAGLAFIVPTMMAYLMYRSSFAGSGMAMGLTIFCLVFMTIGGILLFVGGRSLWRGWRSTTWPEARGVIVYGHRDESQATTHVESEDVVYTSTVSGPHIVYRYEVEGRTHFSNNRRFGQLAGSSDEGWASGIEAAYPLGREVAVRYSADQPDLATLEPGVSKEALWGPGAGAAFFLFGLAALVFGVPALTRDIP